MIPVHILLVEDNKADAKLVQRRLESAQKIRCAVEVAEWLSSGLMLAKNRNFDIAFVDLSLPDSHGIDTVVALRREMPDTPILVLSAQEDLGVATKSMEAGADNFIVKHPDLTTDELEREILYSLERWRRQKISKQLIAKSVERLTMDKDGAVGRTTLPMAGLASAHVVSIEDTVSQVRLFLQRNNPQLAEQAEQLLTNRGYYTAIQELRTLLHMDDNIHKRKTISLSQQSMKVVAEATADAPVISNPEADLLEVMKNLTGESSRER